MKLSKDLIEKTADQMSCPTQEMSECLDEITGLRESYIRYLTNVIYACAKEGVDFTAVLESTFLGGFIFAWQYRNLLENETLEKMMEK